MFKKYYTIINVHRSFPRLLISIEHITNSYWVKQKIFIFWIQLNYKSNIIDKNRENQVLRKIAKKSILSMN